MSRKGSRGILGYTEAEWLEEKGHLKGSNQTATNPIRVYLTDSQYFYFGLACIRRQENLSDHARNIIQKEFLGIDENIIKNLRNDEIDHTIKILTKHKKVYKPKKADEVEIHAEQRELDLNND